MIQKLKTKLEVLKKQKEGVHQKVSNLLVLETQLENKIRNLDNQIKNLESKDKNLVSNCIVEHIMETQEPDELSDFENSETSGSVLKPMENF